MTLLDDPDRQRQIQGGWDFSEGNLLLLGVPGSGTTTTLASIALTLGLRADPADLDILVLDMSAGDLRPLKDLPHTVAYVGAGSRAKEEQSRFLRYLRDELKARKADPKRRTPTVILVDGMAALKDEFQDFQDDVLLDAFYRAYAEGPGVGLHFAVTSTRAKAVPPVMDEVTLQKWLFKLADPYDYSILGVKGKTIPAPLPGRCVDPRRQLQMHVATAAMTLPDATVRVRARWQSAPEKDEVIGTLPTSTTPTQIGACPQLNVEPWRIPVGIQESDLQPGILEIYPGEHVLIAGPPRSGRSGLLLALAQSLRGFETSHGTVQVWGVCSPRSPLATAELDRVAVGADEVSSLLAATRLESSPIILMVDDAERVSDTDQALDGLINEEREGFCVIAAGRTDDLKSLYGHWTKTLRKSRLGVVLQPADELDGDLLGMRIPRRPPVAMTTGRGYIGVGGQAQLIQAMMPDQAECTTPTEGVDGRR